MLDLSAVLFLKHCC